MFTVKNTTSFDVLCGNKKKYSKANNRKESVFGSLHYFFSYHIDSGRASLNKTFISIAATEKIVVWLYNSGGVMGGKYDENMKSICMNE